MSLSLSRFIPNLFSPLLKERKEPTSSGFKQSIPSEIFELIFQYSATPFRDPANNRVLKSVEKINQGPLGSREENIDAYFHFWKQHRIPREFRSIFINPSVVNFLLLLDKKKYASKCDFVNKIKKYKDIKTVIKSIKLLNETEIKTIIQKKIDKFERIDFHFYPAIHPRTFRIYPRTFRMNPTIFSKIFTLKQCLEFYFQAERKEDLNTIPQLPNCQFIRIKGAELKLTKSPHGDFYYHHNRKRQRDLTAIKKISFELFPKCISFYLHYTHFTAISIDKASKCQSLFLDHNDLLKIQFSPSLPACTQLSLGDNFLKTIQLPSLPACTYLSLKGNLLKTIQLPPLPNCHYLTLENNFLKTIQLPFLPKSCRVNLMGNPLESIKAKQPFFCKKFFCDHYSVFFSETCPILLGCKNLIIKQLPIEPPTFTKLMKQLKEKVPLLKRLYCSERAVLGMDDPFRMYYGPHMQLTPLKEREFYPIYKQLLQMAEEFPNITFLFSREGRMEEGGMPWDLPTRDS